MIVYSVTVSIETEITEEWLTFMKTMHIPQVMDTGCFLSHRIQRLLDPPSEPGFDTFNMQYEVPSLMDLDRYRAEFAPAIQRDHEEKYKDRFVAFRSVLEIL